MCLLSNFISILQVHTFRRAILDKLLLDPAGDELRVPEVAEAVEDGIQLRYSLGDPVSFRPFGFIDCFGVETNRVGDNLVRNPFTTGRLVHDIQRTFYSGYFRKHGLKCQVVFLPNGMIGSVFIAALAHNDRGMVNLSGINDYLVGLLHGVLLPPHYQMHPALYGDGIYQVLLCIISRFTGTLSPAEQAMNIRMAGVRISIEHLFGLHHNLFALFSHPDLLRLYHRGPEIRNLTLMSFFILNCYNCLNHTSSAMFGLDPPSLEEYIPLDENIPPAPVISDEQLGTVYDFGNRLS
jgi:hypothetical protein